MVLGLIIGIGIILPGVSGGVIAVLLNVYDKIIFAISNFFDNKKENFIFLSKIFIGVIIGAIISANFLSFLFEKYLVEVSYLFIGLVFGTIPLMISNYNKKSSKKLNYYLLLFIAFISILFVILFKDSLVKLGNNKSYLSIFISGILFAIGKIVPGISSSILLNLIGQYDLFLSLFSNPIHFIFNNFFSLIIILFGVFIGAFISIKTMSICLKKYNSTTYSIIIGFAIGSALVMYPNELSFIGILYFILGFIFSLGLPLLKKD